MERKTHKLMDINDNGKHLVCIYNTADTVNPYRLYEVYWHYSDHGTRERRKQIAKYADMKSVLFHVYTMF